MEMQVNSPGGKHVSSSYKGFTGETDQPQSEDGDNSTPDPNDLFLASLAPAPGFNIVYFCESRDNFADEITMTLRFERMPISA